MIQIKNLAEKICKTFEDGEVHPDADELLSWAEELESLRKVHEQEMDSNMARLLLSIYHGVSSICWKMKAAPKTNIPYEWAVWARSFQKTLKRYESAFQCWMPLEMAEYSNLPEDASSQIEQELAKHAQSKWVDIERSERTTRVGRQQFAVFGPFAVDITPLTRYEFWRELIAIPAQIDKTFFLLNPDEGRSKLLCWTFYKGAWELNWTNSYWVETSQLGQNCK